MSAWTTILVTVPLNLYFAYVVRSLYNKVPPLFHPVPLPPWPQRHGCRWSEGTSRPRKCHALSAALYPSHGRHPPR